MDYVVPSSSPWPPRGRVSQLASVLARRPRPSAFVPPADVERVREHRLRNAVQTLLWLVALAAVLGGTAWVLGGFALVVPTVLVVFGLFLFMPRIRPWFLLRLQRAQPLEEWQAPRLHHTLRVLAQRANLPRVPALFRVPSAAPNAFSTGTQREAAIAFSDGILANAPIEEVEAILAHEVAHVAGDDMRLKSFADTMGRLTRLLSGVGMFLVFLNLPLVLLGQVSMSWLGIFLLFLAPRVSALILFALSRTREFDADAVAAELLGEGRTLARALARIERATRAHARGSLAVLVPTFLRTHPETKARIERLLAMEG